MGEAARGIVDLGSAIKGPEVNSTAIDAARRPGSQQSSAVTDDGGACSREAEEKGCEDSKRGEEPL